MAGILNVCVEWRLAYISHNPLVETVVSPTGWYYLTFYEGYNAFSHGSIVLTVRLLNSAGSNHVPLRNMCLGE